MRLAKALLILGAAGVWIASAQTTPTWDASGNPLLKGTYYFRQVLYAVGYTNGELSDAEALYGTISFDGNGNYTCSATWLDASYEEIYAVTPSECAGTYSIAASGFGFMESPLSNVDYAFGLLDEVDDVYGLVSAGGIFVGSATENAYGYNDMFVAAPLSSPVPTTASFSGTYWVAGIDLSSEMPAYTVNSLFQLTPNGTGTLNMVNPTAYIGGTGSTPYSFGNITNVRYAASNGAEVAVFPTSNTALLSGQKYFYISPDGNFIFGGSPESFDMFVGVRASSGSPSFSGLYYQAGIDQDDSGGYGNLDTYYGSLNAIASAGDTIGHQRLLSPFNNNAVDYTSSDSYAVSSNGTYKTGSMSYVVGADGIRIGSGIYPYLGINVSLPGPTFSQSGVFLDPTRIQNAASSAPFTAGVAPGELLTLYGSGLADSTVIAGIPFPSTLGNVQVLINGIQAPIYYVSSTQISAIVPYEVNTEIASVQVINNGSASNTVTLFTNLTSPGVFTVPPGGLGYGAILHQDGVTLVTPSNPAQINETVSVYVTGLGAVSPTVADGAAGPDGVSSPLSWATNTITADISGVAATVTYAGLAPDLSGLYQVNVTIPPGLSAGDNYIDLSGPDSYNSQALISISTTTYAYKPVAK